MSRIRNRNLVAFSCVLTILLSLSEFSSQSVAGVLDGYPTAYDDGNGPAAGAWTGSVAFDNGVGLVGTLDFAVFTAADFNAAFGGTGYVPADLLVYTYQVNNSGTHFISAEIVGIANPASAIGTFNIGDVDASSASLTPNAEWFFGSSIPTGDSSYGLAFSSPQAPMTGVSLTINSGTSSLSAGIPTPGPNAIPEPASLVLAAAGLGVLLMSRKHRNRL